MLTGRALVLLAALLVAGCTRDFLNQPLIDHKSNAELLPVDPPSLSPDEPYIVMSFSGGGIRATAFAYAVLNELARIPDRSGRPFTDDIRIISSASGGSVTAAWFGLKGAKGLPYLHDNFITKDNMWAMELRVFNPVTLVRLAGPDFSRIDVLRKYLDARLFRHATFADMYHLGAPIVILNSTDMATGEVFSFLPRRFDDLCSDLSRFPVAGAVAASAAFPVLLTPLSLKNWSGDPCPVDPYPMRVKMALTSWTRYLNLPAYMAAIETERMRGCFFPCADPNHRTPTVLYQHLLDGGLADNLGTSAILSELFTPGSQLHALNTGIIHNLVAIEVIARSSSPSPVSVHSATPGLYSVIGSVIDNPIDSATRDNAEVFETAIASLRQNGRLRAYVPGPVPIPDHIYSIPVDPDQFDATRADQVKLRDAFEHIPTSWTMNAKALATVEISAHRLLYLQPCFVRLVLDLSAKRPSELAPNIPLGNPAACDYDATGLQTTTAGPKILSSGDRPAD